jgi:hypothetical protein
VAGAGTYVQEKGVQALAGLIRRYPVSSALLGLAVGLLLGRSLGKATTTQGS